MKRDPRRNPTVGDVLYTDGKTLTVADVGSDPWVGPDIGYHIEYDSGKTSIGGMLLSSWRKQMKGAKIILRAEPEVSQ